MSLFIKNRWYNMYLKKNKENMSKYHEIVQFKKQEEIKMYQNFKKVLNTINEKKRLAITKDNIIHCEIKQNGKILTKFIFTKNIHRNNFIFNFETKRILSIVHVFELCLNKYTFISINPLHLNITQRKHENKTYLVATTYCRSLNCQIRLILEKTNKLHDLLLVKFILAFTA